MLEVTFLQEADSLLSPATGATNAGPAKELATRLLATGVEPEELRAARYSATLMRWFIVPMLMGLVVMAKSASTVQICNELVANSERLVLLATMASSLVHPMLVSRRKTPSKITMRNFASGLGRWLLEWATSLSWYGALRFSYIDDLYFNRPVFTSILMALPFVFWLLFQGALFLLAQRFCFKQKQKQKKSTRKVVI